MDLQKMLSQINPEQLQQGMKQLGLSPDQMNAVKNMASGGKPDQGKSDINMNDINAMLKNNPSMAKQLRQAGMLDKINEIFGK